MIGAKKFLYCFVILFSATFFSGCHYFQYLTKNSTVPADKKTLAINELTGNSKNILKVPLYPQETSLWCWAACTQMCMAYIDKPGNAYAQCRQATDVLQEFNEKCCDAQNTNPYCIISGVPHFDKYDFYADSIFTPLSWNEIVNEIKNKRPFIYAYHRSQTNKHMKVITGYKIKKTKKYLYYNDPWPQNVGKTGCISYDEYCRKHWKDYYNISRKS